MIQKLKCWLGWHNKKEWYRESKRTRDYAEFEVQVFCRCCEKVLEERIDTEFYNSFGERI